MQHKRGVVKFGLSHWAHNPEIVGSNPTAANTRVLSIMPVAGAGYHRQNLKP